MPLSSTIAMAASTIISFQSSGSVGRPTAQCYESVG